MRIGDLDGVVDLINSYKTDSIAKSELLYGLSQEPTIDAVPVIQGQWMEEHGQTLIPVEYDDSGNLILHDYTTYRCNLCGRIESKEEPYCNCGAKMNGE